MRRWRVLFVALVGSAVLAGCRTGGAPAPGAATSPSEPRPSSAATASVTGTPEPASPPRTVVLDPGHNGGNARDAKAIGRLVPAGRGQTKPCNTTGTATATGYSEHAFNWDVARRVGAELSAKGISVVYTRTDDTGVGPCVDRRAAIGNQDGAAAVVSIHADGSNSAGAHGFHVAYSSPPLNAAQGEPSTSLARTLRDRLSAAGFALSNYLGRDGLVPRDDLAGLNLSQRPAVLIECGNMRDPAEAALMSTSDGRQRYADAIADGILAYLS